MVAPSTDSLDLVAKYPLALGDVDPDLCLSKTLAVSVPICAGDLDGVWSEKRMALRETVAADAAAFETNHFGAKQSENRSHGAREVNPSAGPAH